MKIQMRYSSQYIFSVAHSTTPHDMQRLSIYDVDTANYVFKYKAALKLIHIKRTSRVSMDTKSIPTKYNEADEARALET